MRTVSVSVKGQVVLPVEVRRKLGIEAGTQLEVAVAGDAVILRPTRRGRASNLFEGKGMVPNKVGYVPVEAFDARIAEAFRKGKS